MLVKPPTRRSLVARIPFADCVMGTRAADRPVTTRTLEHAIVTIVSAYLALQVADDRQDNDIQALKATVAECQSKTAQQIADLSAQIATLQHQPHQQ